MNDVTSENQTPNVDSGNPVPRLTIVKRVNVPKERSFMQVMHAIITLAM